MPLLISKMADLSFPFLSSRHPHPRFKVLFSASASPQNPNSNPKARRYPWESSSPSAPWPQHWTPPAAPPKVQLLEKTRPAAPQTPVDRIVYRLRNLAFDGNAQKAREVEPPEPDNAACLGDLLERAWKRPDVDGSLDVEGGLPWEREDRGVGLAPEVDREPQRRKVVKAPTLAELTLEDAELRRLRRTAILLKERLTVAKAGVTQAIVQKIRQVWRKSELVRLKFHESLAHNMKIAHELVERRTGGLVIWRSGSVMVVYRGPSFDSSRSSQPIDGDKIPVEVPQQLLVPDVSQAASTPAGNNTSTMLLSQESNPSTSTSWQDSEMTEEEAEFNRLLDGLGPRFVDWWGTGILPVDADLLPQNIPGYKTPFRLLPTGMRSRVTSAELTSLRKLARTLPIHFALGRNRNHHGLAAAILKLWEKSLVVKIAVKRGVQNTNNKIMAEELKKLTGGLLLLRNKYFIVMYRGKDFLPTNVASVLAKRQELTRDIQDIEEKARVSMNEALTSKGGSQLPTQQMEFAEGSQDLEENARAPENESPYSEISPAYLAAGTLDEFLEAQARWGREITTEERQEMKKEASRKEVARLVRKIEHKLSVAEAKKLRAEKLLAKIEASMVPVGPPDDLETITEEERTVFRKIGLRMKPYLPLGIRGVFDGVIENMHLHWKYREVVKLISKQKTLSFVEDTARLLEYESGGILVSIEKLTKGYALIYYRGKNYQRPINIRPSNLLTKAKALKRSVAMQRHEALTQRICELENTIQQYQSDLARSEDLEVVQKNDSTSDSDSENEDEDIYSDSDSDAEYDASFVSDDNNEFEDAYTDRRH